MRTLILYQVVWLIFLLICLSSPEIGMAEQIKRRFPATLKEKKLLNKKSVDVQNNNDKSKYVLFASVVQEHHSAKHSISPFTLIINMVADLCPHGMLPLAYGLARGGPTGIIPALVLLLLFGVMSGYSMISFAKLAHHTNSMNISEIWAKLVGYKSAWIIDVALLALCYGCCVFYSAFAGDIFAALAETIRLPKIFANRTNLLVAISLLVLLPLCLQEDLSALQFSSFLGAFGVLFTVGFHVKRWLDGSYDPGSSLLSSIPQHLQPSFPSLPTFTLWKVNSGTLMLANLFCVAFLAHYNSINYYRELSPPSSLPVYQKTVTLGFGIAAMLFAIMMLVGYRLFGANTLPLILNNFPKQTDALANLARLATGLAITFAYPLMFAGLKSAIESLVDRFHQEIAFFSSSSSTSLMGTSDAISNQKQLSNRKTIKTTLLIMSLASITAIACHCGEDDVAVVLGLVGSITGCFVAYILPAFLNLAYMRSRANVGLSNPRWESIANHGLGLAGILFSLLGVYVTFLLPSHHSD